jgi:hypothetical protein
MNGECIRCGVETDSRIGDTWICESCYAARSSCCPEFGPDDLTEGDRKPDSERSGPASGTASNPDQVD